MNPFQDQKQFMLAADQTVGPKLNIEQVTLYIDLIEEELGEMFATDTIEQALKEAADVLVVTIGLMYSFGADPQKVWDAVHASNMTKLTDGKLLKREDGKVLKPDTYVPADLSEIAGRIQYDG